MPGRVSLFVGDLSIGGAEQVVVNLSKGLTDFGYEVDIVMVRKRGKLLNDIPESVNIVELSVNRMRWCLPPLASYLNKTQPQAVISFMTGANIMALLANQICGRPAVTIATEHNTQSMKQSPLMRSMRLIARFIYRLADHIIGVSSGVSEDILRWSNLPDDKVKTIYNPVIEQSLINKQYKCPDHPWYIRDDIDVVLGAGRHVEQKNFETLIRAFSKLQIDRKTRLVLVGEGERTEEYQKLAEDLGISEKICMPGFVDSLNRYMAYSDVFALSSKWEGLSLVLIEAMGCGTPVVSTDCPFGPAEVLADGEYGSLVPVGSVNILRSEIQETLDNPMCSKKLRNRAMDFSIETATRDYVELLEK